MLIAVKLVDQWAALRAELPEDWTVAHVRVRPEQADDLDEVARRLGALGVGRVGGDVVLTLQRDGSGLPTGDAVGRAFSHLDEERIWCLVTLADVTSTPGVAAAPATASVTSLADAWDALVAGLPPDWSDLLCSLALASSSLLDRAALLTAPLNPARDGSDVAFTFRVARRAGYGASPVMVRRCLERMDAESIDCSVRVLRHLAETDRVGTQGPVWLVGGRTL
jgi:hypothetical protein